MIPGAIGFLLAAITEDGATLINIAVFGAAVSYVLMLASHIRLRRTEPDLERPYRRRAARSPPASGWSSPAPRSWRRSSSTSSAAGITAGIFLAFMAYFWFYSRHHLVASAPEEEFDSIKQAEAELAGD